MSERTPDFSIPDSVVAVFRRYEGENVKIGHDAETNSYGLWAVADEDWLATGFPSVAAAAKAGPALILSKCLSEWGATEERTFITVPGDGATFERMLAEEQPPTHYRCCTPWTPVEGSGG